MLRKSLIQFSVDGWGCVPSLLFDLRPNYGGGSEDNDDLLQKAPSTHCHTQCPQPWSRSLLTHASTRDSWTLMAKSGSVSCGSRLLSPGSWCTQGFVCALQASVSPVLCKFWQLYGGVNSDLLQEGVCHIQVCSTQSPCPCGRPLLTRTSEGALKHSSGSLSRGSLGPGVHNVLFEPSEGLWRAWSLILNAISPLHHLSGTSPLPLDVGYHFLVGSNILLSMIIQQ